MNFTRKQQTLFVLTGLAIILATPLTALFANIGGSTSGTNYYATGNDCSAGITPASQTTIDHSFSTNSSSYSIQLNGDVFDTQGNSYWAQMVAEENSSGTSTTTLLQLSVLVGGTYHQAFSSRYTTTLGVGYSWELTLSYSGTAVEGGGELLDNNYNVLFADTSLSYSPSSYNIAGYAGAYSGVYGINTGTPHTGFTPSATTLFSVLLFLHDSSYTYQYSTSSSITCSGPYYGGTNINTAEQSNLSYSGITEYSNEITYDLTT